MRVARWTAWAAALALALVLLKLLATAPRSDAELDPQAQPVRHIAPSEDVLRSADAGPARLDRRPPRSPAAEPSPADAPALSLRAFDASWRPIGGALVRSGDYVGITSAAGELTCRWSDLHGGVATVEADGFSRETVWLPPQLDAVDVVLWEEAAISGVVVDGDGLPAAEQTRVLAWPANRLWLDLPTLESLPDGYFETTTVSGGAFRIRGLRSGEIYGLVAGGHGMATLARAKAEAAPGASVELVVSALVGAALRFQSAAGPVARDREFGGQEILDAPVQLRRVRDWTLAALAGVEIAQARVANAEAFVFADPRSRPEPSPVTLEMTIAGYEKVHVDFSVKPLADGLPEYAVDLIPTRAAGFGTLALLCDGELGQAGARLEPAGMVTLQPLERGSGPLLLSIPGWNRGRATFDGIPAGEYSLSVLFRPGGPLELDRDRVRIGGAPAEVRLLSSGTGRLAILVWDAAGNPFDGPVDLIVGTGGPALAGGEMTLVSMGNVRHLRGPYAFSNLPPGDYSILLASPNLPIAGPNPCHARVSAAAETSIEFTLLH